MSDNGGGQSPQSITAAIVGVLMSFPRWLQALVLVAALAGVGVWFLYTRVPTHQPQATNALPPPISKHQVSSGQPYDLNRATKVDVPNNANNSEQNREAEDKAKEDDLARSWHSCFEVDDRPTEQYVYGQHDPRNFLYYKYFAKDHCLNVHRRATGPDDEQNSDQWMVDPVLCQHKLHATVVPQAPCKFGEHAASEPASRPTSPPQDVLLAGPALFAFLDLITPGPDYRPAPQLVQAGNCINPHPGPFNYWWGPPPDQCNSPMFRQFTDGCTHYQFYNRCANTWDSRIFWTVCVPHR